MADETSQRAIEFEEFQQSLEERGFFLDYSDIHWFYDGYTKYPCPLWQCLPAGHDAELVGFLVVAEDSRARVIGHWMLGASRTL